MIKYSRLDIKYVGMGGCQVIPAQIFFRFGLSRFSEDFYDAGRMKVLFLNKSLLVKMLY